MLCSMHGLARQTAYVSTPVCCCSVHEVSVEHQPGRNLAVKRVDWSTHEQRSSVAKVSLTNRHILLMHTD